MTPTRRAVLACLLLVCIAVDRPPPLRAAPDPPATFQGFLRYKVRGLSAVQGGFLSGGIMGVAAYTGVHAAAGNALRLLGGAAKLSGDPSLAEMHEYMRTGKGFDFSGAPVSAGYDVELEFVLESDGKGTYRLKSGNARYSGNTDADVELNSADGNNHRFTDRFRGMGSARLTPENASITLTTTGSGKDLRLHFDVNVSFPVTLVGKTTWSAMGGLFVISREDKGDVATWRMTTPFSPPFTESGTNSQPAAGVAYGRSGPPERVLRGQETWQDLTDSGVMVEWELWDQCTARIETPDAFDELTFDESTTGRIVRQVKAQVQPTFWDQDLHWKFMPMSGSDIDPTPNRANGNDFDLTYAKLPPKNSSFGFWLLEAEFATERARKAGCTNPKPHEIGYFYTLEANNNPGPAAKEAGTTEPGPDPNWFYYWTQTAAADGRASRIRYGGSTASSCAKPGVGGYYRRGTSHIVVCDLVKKWDLSFTHPWVDYVTEGIDTYGTVVLHEWRHYDYYNAWWRQGQGGADRDGDGMPDRLEGTTPVPAPLNGRHKVFSDSLYDTLGLSFDDEHYLVYMDMTAWKQGSADHEDWSCVGHQTTAGCR